MLYKTHLTALAFGLVILAQSMPAQAQDFNHKASALIDGDIQQLNKGAASQLVTEIGTSSVSRSAGKTDASADIGGSVLIENTATESAKMATLIGSIDTTSKNPNIKAEAVVDHDVVIKNSGNGAIVYTEVGSVNSTRLQGVDPGKISSSGGKQTASAHVKDLDVNNSGNKAYVHTIIGSIEAPGDSKNLEAFGHVDGIVAIYNTGANATVSTAIGSIDGTYAGQSFSNTKASADIKGDVWHRNTADGAHSSMLLGSVR